MSIEDIELTFNKGGIFFISGYNELNGGSNGSGKSSILNSITYSLFGRTSKGLGGDAVNRWGSSKSAEVKICFSNTDGHTYEIVRTPDSISFKIDNINTAGHKRDVQTTINDTFRTNYDLFLSSVMFTRGADFLTDSGDSAKKRLFKSLLGLEQIDKMAEKAKTIYDSLFKEAIILDYGVKGQGTLIEKLESEINTYVIKKVNWEAEKSNKIKALQDSIALDAPIIDISLKQKIKEKEKYKLELQSYADKYEDSVPELQEKLASVYKDVGYYTKNIDELKSTMFDSESIQGTVCTYCGAKITKKGMAFHLQELQNQVIENEDKLTNLYEAMREIESRVLECDNYRIELSKLEKECNNLSMILSSQQHQIEIFESKRAQINERIQAETASSNPYSSLFELKEQEVSELKFKIEDSKKKFKELTSNIDIYSYIKWVLSREGVVSAIIEKTFGRLEALINNYLSSICTEGFKIQIKPQRELKSGALKEEIEIVVIQGDKKIPYSGLSGGQEQRVTIAVLLALYRLSKELGMNRFDFLLLDEIIDLSLDASGKQNVIKLLTRMEEEIKHIFIISHDDEIAADFHFQIDVRRKRDGITVLKEVNY